MRNKYPLTGQRSNGFAPVQGTPKLDTFGNPRSNVFDAVTPATAEEVYDQKYAYENAQPTLLPRHYWAPEGARTINLQKILSVPNGSLNLPVFSFTAVPGSTLVFFNYALSTTAAPLDLVSWKPTVNGSRVLAYHGDPANNFQITSPTGSDLSANNLVPCQILMGTSQTISWTVSNTSGGTVLMGVRMVGYLDMSQRLMSSKFGD